MKMLQLGRQSEYFYRKKEGVQAFWRHTSSTIPLPPCVMNDTDNMQNERLTIDYSAKYV